jgi:small subunit ribosomal protein S16
VAVKIKLKRLGKIRAPYYRIVVADARTKRDGRAIEEIGKYHPKADPSFIEVDSERAQHWLSVGAQPTDPVRKILEITGDWQKYKGLPGTEGTLRTAEPKADRKVVFAAALQETLDSSGATTKSKPKARAEPAVAKTAKAGKPDKAEKAEKADKADKAEKAENAAKPEATAKAEPAEKTEATAKAEPAAKTEATAKAEPAEKAEPAAKAETTATAKAEPAEKAESTAKAEPAEKAEAKAESSDQADAPAEPAAEAAGDAAADSAPSEG